jgi:hypothetical protein
MRQYENILKYCISTYLEELEKTTILFSIYVSDLTDLLPKEDTTIVHVC